MSRNLNHLDLKTSNYFINFIQNNPPKRENPLKKSQITISKLNKISLQKKISKKSIINIHTQELGITKKKSQEKKHKVKSILSPNSKNKIGYLKHFNNNSIYYSNQKRTKIVSIYPNPNINTDVKSNNLKFVIVKNISNLNNVINMKKNCKFPQYKKSKNIKEDSKNNTSIEDTKQMNIFMDYKFLNQNNGAKILQNNKDKIQPKENIKEYKSLSKNKLLNILSSKNLLKSSNKENFISLNNSRINKANNTMIIKMNKFPEIIIPTEYKIINKIGSGSFGEIYKVRWNKNNSHYAMKEMHFQSKDNIIYLKERVNYIIDFQNQSKCDGLIKIYGDSYFKKGKDYYYYEVMELAESDWEQEIKTRKNNLNYYSEKELFLIMIQLIKTLSLLQKNHITHRDIKLQNILLINKKYKICDFGESRKLNQKGTIVQPVRGSELFMSPILFMGLNEKLLQVTHNTYKSDVFSLGMCFLYAATLSDDCLCDIRELDNMDKIRKVLENYLCQNYSRALIEILLFMLEINEKRRPDFIQLEKVISQLE